LRVLLAFREFTPFSKENLEECDVRLQMLFTKVLQIHDISILCGHREETAQNQMYKEGLTRARWPKSAHNKKPSLAVDVAPIPVNWKDREKFIYLAGIVMGLAETMGLNIRWGGDWDGDGNFKDQSFNDLAHFELVL